MSQPTIVVFDLDGTLIDTDCAQHWLSFLKKRDFPNAAAAEACCSKIMQSYATGNMDMPSYMQHWAMPVIGYSVTELEKWANEFTHLYIKPRIFEEGLAQLRFHRQRGDTVILISASPSLLVKPIARLLEVEHFLGLELAMNNNTLHHRLLPPLSFREGKLTCLKHWLNDHKLSELPLSVAYSDSINDVPLLAYANKAVVVNGDQALLTLAQRKHWQTVTWKRYLNQHAGPKGP